MQKTDLTAPDIIVIVLRYNDAFNKGNVDGVMTAMTDDCVVDKSMLPPEGAGSRVRPRYGRSGTIFPGLRPISSSTPKTCSPATTGGWCIGLSSGWARTSSQGASAA
ncbi:uncharacterized protein METZ01_LOCUS20654 [marine metagenome]|uniref:SnoaL-like domain-containing protein n=1 Tax=marine metagenome TaxID=408172 RepID=A0A381PLI7_9ZZZZ